MKKLFYTVAAVFLTCFPTLSAQDNLLANPGFEEWNEGTLQGAWTATDNITLTQEATTKLNGNYALRLETAANSDLYAVGSFKQDVTGTFQQGEVYEVSISFYTVSNGGSTFNRLRLNHRWDNYADPTEPYYQSYEMPVGQWSTQTAEVPVANEGASTFNFIMQTDPGTILIVDDFSFRKKEGASTPYLTVDPARFPTVETTVGTPVEIGKATLYYGNLPVELSEAAGTIYIGGTHKDQFGMKVTRNEPGEMELTLTYAPTKPTTYSMHTARLTIDPQVDGLTASISLSGQASEPGLNPVITADRTEVTFPETPAGTSRHDTVYVSGTELKEGIRCVVTGDSTFTISTNLLPINANRAALGIEYRPVQGGTQTATITLSSRDAETRTIALSGTATGDATNPDKQGDEYPLDDSQPLTLLHETFDNAPHNEPLQLEGWKNIAEQDYRAWWGYDFNYATPPTDEHTAKATLFNSVDTEATPYEMWLYTPALDYEHTDSPMFTFRVMGDLLHEDGNAKIELYYVDLVDGPDQPYRSPIDIRLPSTPDDNGEWMEYHMDLSKQNGVSPTFFMAFRVSGTGGGANAATFYLDDVSFGRTDLPKISLPHPQLMFESQAGATATTQDIAVTTENLAEPIKLTIGGADKSMFKVVPETLPVEGGSFHVEFSSDQIRWHEAYVKLASRGAADVYLDLIVNNKQQSSGFDAATVTPRVWCNHGRIHLDTSAPIKVRLFDLAGHEIMFHTLPTGIHTLPNIQQPGMYLLQLTYADGTNTCQKVVVKE